MRVLTLFVSIIIFLLVASVITVSAHSECGPSIPYAPVNEAEKTPAVLAIRKMAIVENSFHAPMVETAHYGQFTDHWRYGSATVVTDKYVRLTPQAQSKTGFVTNDVPVHMHEWEVAIGFRIHNNGGSRAAGADGFAFWYTQEQISYDGTILGHPDKFVGLGILVDTYDNNLGANHAKIIGTVAFPQPHSTPLRQNDDFKDRNMNSGSKQKSCSANSVRTNTPPVDDSHVLFVKYENRRVTVTIQYAGKSAPSEECFVMDDVQLPHGFYYTLTAATGGIGDNHDITFFYAKPLTGRTSETTWDHDYDHHETQFNHHHDKIQKEAWRAKTKDEEEKEAKITDEFSPEGQKMKDEMEARLIETQRLSNLRKKNRADRHNFKQNVIEDAAKAMMDELNGKEPSDENNNNKQQQQQPPEQQQHQQQQHPPVGDHARAHIHHHHEHLRREPHPHAKPITSPPEQKEEKSPVPLPPAAPEEVPKQQQQEQQQKQASESKSEEMKKEQSAPPPVVEQQKEKEKEKSVPSPEKQAENQQQPAAPSPSPSPSSHTDEIENLKAQIEKLKLKAELEKLQKEHNQAAEQARNAQAQTREQEQQQKQHEEEIIKVSGSQSKSPVEQQPTPAADAQQQQQQEKQQEQQQKPNGQNPVAAIAAQSEQQQQPSAEKKEASPSSTTPQSNSQQQQQQQQTAQNILDALNEDGNDQQQQNNKQQDQPPVENNDGQDDDAVGGGDDEDDDDDDDDKLAASDPAIKTKSDIDRAEQFSVQDKHAKARQQRENLRKKQRAKGKPKRKGRSRRGGSGGSGR